MELTKKDKEKVDHKARNLASMICLGMDDNIKAKACYNDSYPYYVKEYTKKALEMKEKGKRVEF